MQRKYCNILQHPNRIADAEKAFIPSPAMAYCIQRAKAEGLEVSLIWKHGRITVSRIRINGNIYVISSIESQHRYIDSGPLYYHLGVRNNKSRLVCTFDGSRWTAFIFPHGPLVKQSYYIPVNLDKPPYNNHVSQIDWKSHREAWHLLKGGGGEKIVLDNLAV